MDITKCTSTNCPYKTKCYRQVEEEPPNKYNIKPIEYNDFKYDCNSSNGYPYFDIPIFLKLKGDD